jgi:hypothetical protein
VGQRVLDRLEQGLVELGLATLHLQPDGLLQLHAEVADDARQLGPDVVDRLHARLHDAFLQLAGDQVEPLRRADEVRVGLAGDVLHDLVTREDQLADQQHQFVEQVDVHADGAVGDGPAALAVAGRRRRGLRLVLGGRVHDGGLLDGGLLDGALGHCCGCSLGAFGDEDGRELLGFGGDRDRLRCGGLPGGGLPGRRLLGRGRCGGGLLRCR